MSQGSSKNPFSTVPRFALCALDQDGLGAARLDESTVRQHLGNFRVGVVKRRHRRF